MIKAKPSRKYLKLVALLLYYGSVIVFQCKESTGKIHTDLKFKSLVGSFLAFFSLNVGHTLTNSILILISFASYIYTSMDDILSLYADNVLDLIFNFGVIGLIMTILIA